MALVCADGRSGALLESYSIERERCRPPVLADAGRLDPKSRYCKGGVLQELRNHVRRRLCLPSPRPQDDVNKLASFDRLPASPLTRPGRPPPRRSGTPGNGSR